MNVIFGFRWSKPIGNDMSIFNLTVLDFFVLPAKIFFNIFKMAYFPEALILIFL